MPSLLRSKHGGDDLHRLSSTTDTNVSRKTIATTITTTTIECRRKHNVAAVTFLAATAALFLGIIAASLVHARQSWLPSLSPSSLHISRSARGVGDTGTAADSESSTMRSPTYKDAAAGGTTRGSDNGSVFSPWSTVHAPVEFFVGLLRGEISAEAMRVKLAPANELTGRVGGTAPGSVVSRRLQGLSTQSSVLMRSTGSEGKMVIQTVEQKDQAEVQQAPDKIFGDAAAGKGGDRADDGGAAIGHSHNRAAGIRGAVGRKEEGDKVGKLKRKGGPEQRQRRVVELSVEVENGEEERTSYLNMGEEGQEGEEEEDAGRRDEDESMSESNTSFRRGAISQEGEGGKLHDGRNRCFVDGEGSHRCYPNVFFFGTSKCGTTSLARWLDAHPATNWVANPRRPTVIEETGVREAHVFDDSPKDTRRATNIMHHDKLAVTSPKVDADAVVIDYTPHYIAVAEVPHRIADMYGTDSGLKFIVTLREPTSRTISSWQFKNEYNPRKKGPEETRSLVKTVKEGKRRAAKLEACVAVAKNKALTLRDRDLRLCNPRRFLEVPLYVSHVGKSMYALQLERWFDLFGRENFKVIFTDDMAVNPVGVLEDVLEFLGLDLTDEDASKGLPDRQQWNKITGMAYNKTKAKKKDELGDQVTNRVTDNLRQFFEPYNRRLEELLGSPVPDSWN